MKIIKTRKVLVAVAVALTLSALLAACSPDSADEGAQASSNDGECAWSVGYEVDGNGLVQTAGGNLVDVHDF